MKHLFLRVCSPQNFLFVLFFQILGMDGAAYEEPEDEEDDDEDAGHDEL